MNNREKKKLQKKGILCPLLDCCGKMIVKNNPTKFYLECQECQITAKDLKEWKKILDKSSKNTWEDILNRWERRINQKNK